jgi:hypothetical protein
VAHVHQTNGGEATDRFPHDADADAVLPGQFPFRRKRLLRPERPVNNQIGQMTRHLLAEPRATEYPLSCHIENVPV